MESSKINLTLHYLKIHNCPTSISTNETEANIEPLSRRRVTLTETGDSARNGNLKRCNTLKEDYKVFPHVTWGSLPINLQE